MQSSTATGKAQPLHILRRRDSVVSAREDTIVGGTCRVCRCVYERACPSGCSWANASETLCSACVIFVELSRREIVTMLFDAGYLASTDLRRVAGELPSAIEDFALLFEALTGGDETFETIDFALRNWRTFGAVAVGLEQHGLRVAKISRKELACAA